MNIAIKSVPPLVASAVRQMPVPNPMANPPKILIKSMSYVIGRAGITSVKILVNTIHKQDNPVNFLPIALKQMNAGTEFSTMLIGA